VPHRGSEGGGGRGSHSLIGVALCTQPDAAIIRAVKVVLAIGLALLVVSCGGEEETFRNTSPAMEPTIHCAIQSAPGCHGHEDEIMVVEMSGSQGIKRGDIIIFEGTAAVETTCGASGRFVKRVIGLAGETIDLSPSGLHVNGEPVEAPYVDEDAIGVPSGRWTVSADSYFLIGDNLRASCDSREYGGVPKENILGKVTAIKRGDETINVG
jgi:signal peptidase I